RYALLRTKVPPPLKSKSGQDQLAHLRKPKEKMRSAAARQLLEFFRNYRELQLSLGERLNDHSLGAFGGGVLGGSHFADEQVLGALEHFLFTEGEGLVAAQGNQTLEDSGDFNQRSRAH